MDTDQLMAFARIVREGSFTRAAQSLAIGQPAVSARIQALEAAVGGPLFTRGRRVKLTPLGDSFLPYAARALEVLDEGLEVGRLVHTGHRGRITLAALGSLAGGLVGPAMVKVAAAYPRVEWSVRGGDHERCLTLLLDGVVSLALLTWPVDDAVAADLVELARFHEPVTLVASPDHALARLAKRRAVTQDDVVRHAQLFLRLRWWRSQHPAIVELAERAGVTVDVPMETARHLVLGGAAVGFFTRTYIADDLAEKRLCEIVLADRAPLFRDSALVRRARSAPLARAATELVTAIRAEGAARGLVASSRRRAVAHPWTAHPTMATQRRA